MNEFRDIRRAEDGRNILWQWNDPDNKGHIKEYDKNLERFRYSNNYRLEEELEGQYLPWVCAERLENTCLPAPSKSIFLMMCIQTNMNERNYFGGLEALQRLTSYKRATVTKHLGILEESGLVKPFFKKGQMFHNGIRQNYHLIVPPQGITDCANWKGHNVGLSHLKEYPKYLKRMLCDSELDANEHQNEENSYPYVDTYGRIISNWADEINQGSIRR